MEGKPPTAAQKIGIAVTVLAVLAFVFMLVWARLAQY